MTSEAAIPHTSTAVIHFPSIGKTPRKMFCLSYSPPASEGGLGWGSPLPRNKTRPFSWKERDGSLLTLSHSSSSVFTGGISTFPTLQGLLRGQRAVPSLALDEIGY